MSCRQIELMHRYHDGELSVEGRADVDRHLLECAECRTLLDDLRKLSFVIGQAGMRPLSEEGLARLQVSWRSAGQRGVIRLAGWLTAAAAVLILVLLARPGSERVELAARPAIWETLATTPPVEGQEAGNAEVLVMAQWMADELSLNQKR